MLDISEFKTQKRIKEISQCIGSMSEFWNPDAYIFYHCLECWHINIENRRETDEHTQECCIVCGYCNTLEEMLENEI